MNHMFATGPFPCWSACKKGKDGDMGLGSIDTGIVGKGQAKYRLMTLVL